MGIILEVLKRNWLGQTVSEVWNMSPIKTDGWYMTSINLWVYSMQESFESIESSVFVCESVYVWYEMNYESLIYCCLVEIEI